MEIQLMTAHCGSGQAYDAGTILNVSKAEADRMIDSGGAVAVEQPRINKKQNKQTRRKK